MRLRFCGEGRGWEGAMNKAGRYRENGDFYGGQQGEKERRAGERQTLHI